MYKTIKHLFFLSLIVLLGFSVSCTNSTKKVRQEIMNDDFDIVYGSDSTELTIYMFNDYNCVHCRRFLAEVLPLIKKKYVDTGKINFVLKLMNFSSNDKIINAYKTAICLNKYGDFTELNKLLIIQPSTIHTLEFEEIIEDFMARNSFFAECMLNGEVDNYLFDIKKQYIVNQFTGTPTFVINNNFYKGFRDFKSFEKIIQKELK